MTGDSITIRWLTEIDFFKQYVRLVAGENGLERKVTYVTVQEAPDLYRLLSGGEFVLSTWYAFRDNIEEAGLAALRNLNRTVSGICIKTNRFLDEIPQSYIDFANAEDLPLFAVDKDVNFREIIKSVTIEINMSQMNTLIRINDYYNFLFKAALENGSADFMLGDFYIRTGLVAVSISGDFKQIRGLKSLQKAHGRKFKLDDIKRVIKANQPCMEYFHEGDCHVYPCVARGTCYGYLIVLSGEELSEGDKLYIMQLRNIITIKWLDRQEKENDQLMSLLGMIMRSPDENAGRIADLLDERSIDISSGVRAMVLKYACDDENLKKTIQNEAQQFILYFSGVVPNLLAVWNRSDAYTILIDGQGGGDTDTAPAWIKEVSALLEKYRHLSLAVGPSVSKVGEIRTSVRIATNTHLFARGEKLSYYGDYLSVMGLLGGANSKECDYFVKEVIAPLVRYDEENKSCIMETLESVIHSGDIAQTAAELQIHANSVRYRLQKIKTITDLDFFDSMDRYAIITAFLMHKKKVNYIYQKRT